MNNKIYTKKIRDYYNSKDTNEFHRQIGGREDLHIGIYTNKKKTIKDASRNTILKMVKRLPSIKKKHKILDIGSGYGGAARFLAEKYGCRVDCLNLSETQNKLNLEKVATASLEKLVSVTTGNFKQIPFDRETYDIVWSQDALLYSKGKLKVFWEVARVLKPEGRFIFTDLMQTKNCPDDVLTEIVEQLQLKELGAIKLYKRLANRADLEQVLIKKMPEQLVNHYTAVLENLNRNHDKMAKKVSKEFLQKTKVETKVLLEASKNNYLTWGMLQFQKRNA